jgi:methionyl-tRNA synthetase
MAKDILKFHAIIWPALLLALKLPLPKMVFAHGFFTIDNQKVSKSIGNVIHPDELIGQYGVDATRYLLLSQFPFGADGDFSRERLKALYNSALANGLGNLVYRVLTMTEKYCAGAAPKYEVDPSKELSFDLKGDWHRYDFLMKMLKYDEALAIVFEDISAANSYIDSRKPWELFKVEYTDSLVDVIYNLLEVIRQIAWMLWPFMPATAENILVQLGYNAAKEKEAPIEKLRQWAYLKKGQKIKKGEPLFPRIDKEESQPRNLPSRRRKYDISNK